MFEYDPAKSDTNLAKHGIDFEIAQRLWQDEWLLQVKARQGITGEPRWLCIGRIGSRHWSAVITMREDVIRLISVRRSRPEEIELYEQEKF